MLSMKANLVIAQVVLWNTKIEFGRAMTCSLNTKHTICYYTISIKILCINNITLCMLCNIKPLRMIMHPIPCTTVACDGIMGFISVAIHSIIAA